MKYTYETGAEYLKIGERTLRTAKNAGKIGYSRIGRRVTFTQDDLDRFAAENHVPPKAAV